MELDEPSLFRRQRHASRRGADVRGKKVDGCRGPFRMRIVVACHVEADGRGPVAPRPSRARPLHLWGHREKPVGHVLSVDDGQDRRLAIVIVQAIAADLLFLMDRIVSGLESVEALESRLCGDAGDLKGPPRRVRGTCRRARCLSGPGAGSRGIGLEVIPSDASRRRSKDMALPPHIPWIISFLGAFASLFRKRHCRLGSLVKWFPHAAIKNRILGRIGRRISFEVPLLILFVLPCWRFASRTGRYL